MTPCLIPRISGIVPLSKDSNGWIRHVTEDFFTCVEGMEDEASDVVEEIAKKIVQDMPSEARVNSVVKYFAHERKMLLPRPLARRVHLTCSMYMKAVPPWCNNKIPCYQQIISRWINPEWRATHRAASERRALMGGLVDLQGNLNLHAYVQKKNREEVRVKSCSIPSRDYVSPARQEEESRLRQEETRLRLEAQANAPLQQEQAMKMQQALIQQQEFTAKQQAALQEMFARFSNNMQSSILPDLPPIPPLLTFSFCPQSGEGTNNNVVGGCTPSQASSTTHDFAKDALASTPQ
ncbi:hypothetical protein D1007_58095 [Hordeum vulgare]|nr:hypothetical protein D1007_58095 [Hordeum vulgare]